MNRIGFVSCLLALLICGCATLDSGDRLVLREHNVAPALQDKMAHGVPLSVVDVIELTRDGLPGPFIIHYLQGTEAPYPLRVQDIAAMKEAGVSPDVINYMLSTPGFYRPPVYAYPGSFPYDPYYYGDPYWADHHYHHF